MKLVIEIDFDKFDVEVAKVSPPEEQIRLSLLSDWKFREKLIGLKPGYVTHILDLTGKYVGSAIVKSEKCADEVTTPYIPKGEGR